MPRVFLNAIAASVLLASNVLAANPSLNSDINAVAALRGDPRSVSAAGVMRDETPILTIENAAAFDPAATKRRLALVGPSPMDGDDRSAEAVVAAVRWFKTRAPRAIRDQWIVSALPSARFEAADTQSLSRWIAFQAPDLVVTIGGDPVRQDSVPSESIGITGTAAALQKLLLAVTARSPLHETLLARVQRDPLAIARVLAKRYPATPSISYIPAVSWVNTLRLATVDNDLALRKKVLDQIEPWLSEQKKMFGDRIQLTSIAGAMVFAHLAGPGASNAAGRLAAEANELARVQQPDGIAQYGQGWTDDMFMASSILARTSDPDAAAPLLTSYAARLQRADGLFNHAVEGPIAWGRGNGFAAMGLAEALTTIAATYPARPALLDVYRRQMAAVRAQQAPDGMWRQIVDAPGAYREETATAMLMSAMARGVRLGWLDRSYVPAVQRAWRALAAHVALDGTLVDVCAATGAGPTRRYYFDRPAATGADDRGGAMALLASMEMYELAKLK